MKVGEKGIRERGVRRGMWVNEINSYINKNYEGKEGLGKKSQQQRWRSAHRGMDDVKQGLVTVNADFPIGQGGHDSLQAPGTLLQEVHGQDGCRHLHCPQLLTLARNSQCVCREFRASSGKEGQPEQKGREGSGLTGRWCGGVGLARDHTLWVKPCRLSWVLPTTRVLCTRTSPTGWALNSMQYLGCLESLWNKHTISTQRSLASGSRADPSLLSTPRLA